MSETGLGGTEDALTPDRFAFERSAVISDCTRAGLNERVRNSCETARKFVFA